MYVGVAAHEALDVKEIWKIAYQQGLQYLYR